jgi:hypothetical protein
MADVPTDLEGVGGSFAKMMGEPGGCYFVPLYCLLFFASWHVAWKAVDRLVGDSWGESFAAGLLRLFAWCVLFGGFYLGACWPLRRIQKRIFGSHG